MYLRHHLWHQTRENQNFSIVKKSSGYVQRRMDRDPYTLQKFILHKKCDPKVLDFLGVFKGVWLIFGVFFSFIALIKFIYLVLWACGVFLTLEHKECHCKIYCKFWRTYWNRLFCRLCNFYVYLIQIYFKYKY